MFQNLSQEHIIISYIMGEPPPNMLSRLARPYPIFWHTCQDGKGNASLARRATVGVAVFIITIITALFSCEHIHTVFKGELRDQVVHMVIHPAR